MDQRTCLCNSELTLRCTSCNDKVYLCQMCIPTNLNQNPNHNIIPINTIQRISSSEIICSKCSSGNPEFLEILENAAMPICKPCKHTHRNEDTILVLSKWKEIVTSIKDLVEMGLRKKKLSQALEEIENLAQYKLIRLL